MAIEDILGEVIYGNVTILDMIVSFVIIAAAALIGKTITIYIDRVLRDKVSKDRLSTITKSVYYVIILIGIVTALPYLQVNLSGLLVAGGITAIVIGFAAQSIVGNFISGIFLTVERPMKVGDVINVGGGSGNTGIVEDIRIISTTIRTFDGVYVRIPNESVFTSNITNYLENPARRFEYEIGIRYSDDAEEAMEIIKQLIEDHPLALKNPEPQVYVNDLGSSSVNIKVRIWGPSTEWFTIKIELLWKIKKTLEENDIKVPFTQQEVWFMNEPELKGEK